MIFFVYQRIYTTFVAVFSFQLSVYETDFFIIISYFSCCYLFWATTKCGACCNYHQPAKREHC